MSYWKWWWDINGFLIYLIFFLAVFIGGIVLSLYLLFNYPIVGIPILIIVLSFLFFYLCKSSWGAYKNSLKEIKYQSKGGNKK